MVFGHDDETSRRNVCVYGEVLTTVTKRNHSIDDWVIRMGQDLAYMNESTTLTIQLFCSQFVFCFALNCLGRNRCFTSHTPFSTINIITCELNLSVSFAYITWLMYICICSNLLSMGQSGSCRLFFFLNTFVLRAGAGRKERKPIGI